MPFFASIFPKILDSNQMPEKANASVSRIQTHTKEDLVRE